MSQSPNPATVTIRTLIAAISSSPKARCQVFERPIQSDRLGRFLFRLMVYLETLQYQRRCTSQNLSHLQTRLRLAFAAAPILERLLRTRRKDAIRIWSRSRDGFKQRSACGKVRPLFFLFVFGLCSSTRFSISGFISRLSLPISAFRSSSRNRSSACRVFSVTTPEY